MGTFTFWYRTRYWPANLVSQSARISIATSQLLALVLFLGAVDVYAQEGEEELLSTFGDEEFISMATGQRQQISKAPSTASVITSGDIKAIGATSLTEALETVPGLQVSVNPAGYNPLYIIRGIYTENNAQVLLLINGVPATQLLFGNRGQAWGRMPVANIERIEIIRGPGSALYGADAFAGVINVITKGGSEIGGTEIGARVGSFRTGEAWLLHSADIAGWNTGFYLDYYQTDGQDRTIIADQQTFWDSRFGSRASLAPGPVNLDLDTVHARLDAAKDRWRIRLAYKGVTGGVGAGANQALDPFGDAKTNEYTADISYRNRDLAEDWDITGRLALANYSIDNDLTLLPPGATFPTGTFSAGLIGKPNISERDIRFDLSAFYTGIERHRLRFGAGYQYLDLYDIEESKNFFQEPGVPFPIPLSSLEDVSDTTPFLEEGDRRVTYLFGQDEWQIAPDWELTAGFRYDHYSDFGGTINPRLALVWQTAYNLTSKLMYGKSFRPPSFSELFNINNPVALGNPDLDPETINWLEFGFDYQPTGYLHAGLNLFYYNWDDIIRFVPDPRVGGNVAQNTGSQTGYGLELELQWDITRDLVLRGNYAYQESTDDETDTNAGMAPRNLVYIRGDWQFHPDWLFNTTLNGVFRRARQPGDQRSPIDDYVTVDLTVRRDLGKSGLGAAFSIRNLFDADVREPSPAPGFILDDLPLAGRNIYGEISYRF